MKIIKGIILLGCSGMLHNIYVTHSVEVSTSNTSVYFSCYCYLELRRNLPCVFLSVSPIQHGEIIQHKMIP